MHAGHGRDWDEAKLKPSKPSDGRRRLVVEEGMNNVQLCFQNAAKVWKTFMFNGDTK
jgi:hypothetical protein